MRAQAFRSIAMDSMPAETTSDAGRWLWDGFLMPGDLTLLTSRWKTGKTTLLAGLLQRLGTGEPGAFAVTTDPRERQFEENWQTVLAILEAHTAALTYEEIAEHWPDDAAKPGMTTLYGWLNSAAAREWVGRQGQGTRNNPWRYRVE